MSRHGPVVLPRDRIRDYPEYRRRRDPREVHGDILPIRDQRIHQRPQDPGLIRVIGHDLGPPADDHGFVDCGGVACLVPGHLEASGLHHREAASGVADDVVHLLAHGPAVDEHGPVQEYVIDRGPVGVSVLPVGGEHALLAPGQEPSDLLAGHLVVPHLRLHGLRNPVRIDICSERQSGRSAARPAVLVPVEAYGRMAVGQEIE